MIPVSREAMIAAGWTRLHGEPRKCYSKNCGVLIEFWRNPKTDGLSPIEVEGFVPHYGKCPDSRNFRKSDKPKVQGKLF